jgi:hypothetical protein
VADVGTVTDPAVAVRSLGPATFVTPVLIPVERRQVTPARLLSVQGIDDPDYAGPSAPLLAQGLVASTEQLLDLGPTSMRVLWSGVPWGDRRLAVVLITRPGGGRLQATVGEQDGSWFPVGVRALADDEPDEAPWLLEPFSPADPTLLLCPSGPGVLDYQRRGRPAVRLPVKDNGVAALQEPGHPSISAGGARVVLRDGSGRPRLATVLPEAGSDDVLAVKRT